MELSKEEQKHYSRHLILEEIGLIGQQKLKNAKVLVIGAGGLSCPVLQYLTAAGIGTLGIIDDDVVAQSNLQRQILYTYQDIGQNKAETAAKRLSLLNPFVTFNIYTTRLEKSNAIKLFKQYDIIVDGSDNFPTRYLVNDAAVITNKPLVFGSIFKFEGQVAVLNYKNGPTYRCLYPEPPKPDEVPNCSEIGVLGVLPGIIGCLQANEVLKIVCGIGEVLSGKLVTFHALYLKQGVYNFKKNPSISIKSLEDDYLSLCGVPKAMEEISFQEYLAQPLNFNLLDVRTETERSESAYIRSIHIPLNELAHRCQELPINKNLLVFCKSGVRSKLAIEILEKQGFAKQLVNLKGGYN